MRKQEAQAEILRRLELQFYPINAKRFFNLYKFRRVSKLELLRMITIGENGKWLKEPKIILDEENKYKTAFEKQKQYQKAREEADKLINDYDGE